MRTSPLLLGLLLAVPFLLAGCGPKVNEMKAGLIKSGMPADQAECYAEEMKGMDSGPYNYMAKLLNAGVSESDAINKTRRKYGADFKAEVEKARETCGE
ncbi:MAG: hypothetical protein Q7Q73_02185 [Verrucomicrobiota bacterium JB024]|nr:hypothetical protein [Verrucomicrobiota bacterium JB024]